MNILKISQLLDDIKNLSSFSKNEQVRNVYTKVARNRILKIKKTAQTGVQRNTAPTSAPVARSPQVHQTIPPAKQTSEGSFMTGFKSIYTGNRPLTPKHLAYAKNINLFKTNPEGLGILFGGIYSSTDKNTINPEDLNKMATIFGKLNKNEKNSLRNDFSNVNDFWNVIQRNVQDYEVLKRNFRDLAIKKMEDLSDNQNYKEWINNNNSNIEFLYNDFLAEFFPHLKAKSKNGKIILSENQESIRANLDGAESDQSEIKAKLQNQDQDQSQIRAALPGQSQSDIRGIPQNQNQNISQDQVFEDGADPNFNQVSESYHCNALAEQYKNELIKAPDRIAAAPGIAAKMVNEITSSTQNPFIIIYSLIQVLRLI